MTATLHLKQLALPLAIIGAVFGIAAALLLSPATLNHPALGKAALADLLVTGPVLFLVFAYLRELPLIIPDQLLATRIAGRDGTAQPSARPASASHD